VSDSSTIALSGNRCSGCKPVVLVTLGGCHLLDGMLVVSDKAHKEDFAVLRRRDCEGYWAHPTGDTKSNSSRARHEELQVVRLCQSARACGKHSTWESVTYGSPIARGLAATLELVSTETSLLINK
jgi:hypothetical protein